MDKWSHHRGSCSECDACTKFVKAETAWRPKKGEPIEIVDNHQSVCEHLREFRMYHGPWNEYPRSWTCGACFADFEQAARGLEAIRVDPPPKKPRAWNAFNPPPEKEE